MTNSKQNKQEIKNVTILGAGVLGSQIAWQTAWQGFNVVVYNRSEKGLERAKQNHESFGELFKKDRGASESEIDSTHNRLTYTTDLAEAVMDADITSESVPEDLEIKKELYRKLATLAPEKTILTTNSSTLLPSEFAAETGRPEKFVALHFANGIWDANVGEVMGHPKTDPKIFDRVVEFAREIGMVPIPIHKEQNGYVLNSLLVPLLSAAANLYMNDVADHESIDKTWMIATGVKVGPFGIMDMVGMQTMYNIDKLWGEKLGDKVMLDRAKFIKENYIDKGKMGISTGEGFYKYPNPSYQDPDFLK